MPYFRDLREYIADLEEKQLLRRIKRPVRKETELFPLVRWQYRGLSEDQRRAFLFENVVDREGRRSGIPVLVGALAGSTQIYAAGMRCKPDEISAKWLKAQTEPVPPRRVKTAAAQEVVIAGRELKEEGLGKFPFVVELPGFDGMQRVSASNLFSRDPETGATNIGCYSAFVHAPDRMTIATGRGSHVSFHMEKARKAGKPLQAALVVGVVPAVAFVSVAKVPYGMDEMAVACGLAGEPLDVVRCRTVDVDVPASAEVVIEGEIPTDYMEDQTGSFGEYCGYMAETSWLPVFNVSCITHRTNPIFCHIISQMPPSEGSKIRQIAWEANLLKFLRNDCNLPSVTSVAFPEMSGAWQFCVVQLRKTHNSQPWQALHAASNFESSIAKITVAVDEDVDPHDPEAIIWALSFRVQPQRDVRVTAGKIGRLDPSTAPPGSSRDERHYPGDTGVGGLLIDATRKWDYPPTALPAQEYMENAREIWEAEGLPKLTPKKPWHGYELGYWPEKYAEAARLNLDGRLFELGERRKQTRRPFVTP